MSPTSPFSYILQLIYDRCPPAAIIAQDADPLIVSGSVLGKSWFDNSIPIVEYQKEDIFQKIKNGDMVKVNGETGEIVIMEVE